MKVEEKEMKMKDVKTLITGSVVLIALILYMVFGDPPPEKIEDQVITVDEALEITGGDLQKVELVSVNDGDTMNVNVDGEKERVRLLMIDTPEMNYNKGEPMPYAEEAQEFTKKLLENANNIELLFDVGPKTDKYDRLLAYVFVDDVLLQEALLKEGLAVVRYIDEPNNSLEEQFYEIQQIAKTNKKNIWTTDDYFVNGRFNEDFKLD